MEDLRWLCPTVWDLGKDNENFLHMVSFFSRFVCFFVSAFQQVRTDAEMPLEA